VHDDRDLGRGFLGGLNRRRLEADDDVNPSADKFCCQIGKSLCLALSGTNIELYILPLGISYFVQTLPEHSEKSVGIGSSDHQYTNRLSVLSPASAGPCRQAGQQYDELAPFH